jgi:hypothetical protein
MSKFGSESRRTSFMRPFRAPIAKGAGFPLCPNFRIWLLVVSSKASVRMLRKYCWISLPNSVVFTFVKPRKHKSSYSLRILCYESHTTYVTINGVNLFHAFIQLTVGIQTMTIKYRLCNERNWNVLWQNEKRRLIVHCSEQIVNITSRCQNSYRNYLNTRFVIILCVATCQYCDIFPAVLQNSVLLECQWIETVKLCYYLVARKLTTRGGLSEKNGYS